MENECKGTFREVNDGLGKHFHCNDCGFAAFDSVPHVHPRMPVWFGRMVEKQLEKVRAKEPTAATETTDQGVKVVSVGFPDGHPSHCACSDCLAEVFAQELVRQ